LCLPKSNKVEDAHPRRRPVHVFGPPANHLNPLSFPLLAEYLSGGGLDLGLRALGALLANDALSLALGGGGGALGLLVLLAGGSGGLLLLGLLDGLRAGSGASLRSHGAALLDDIERSTNDGTLGLDGAAGALLGNFLRNTLAVLATEENGPCNATGVLALEEQRLGLAVLEAEDLGVATDVELTLAGVDSLAREGIVVGSHFGE
jgi:hypothetical protein